MNAAAMVNRCFRHQHPEAYDREAVSDAEIPSDMRWGIPESYPSAPPAMNEEAMGNGEYLC